MSETRDERGLADEQARTTWRYCLAREQEDGEDVFTVREVYTGPDGGLSWTTEPSFPNGSSWREAVNDIALMSAATNGRVLDLTLDPPRLVKPSGLSTRPGRSDA